MSATPLRRTAHDRLTMLEERVDKHDQMKAQLDEIYTAFKNAKMIFRFFGRMWVKIIAGLSALIGGLAALLTVLEKAAVLFGHH